MKKLLLETCVLLLAATAAHAAPVTVKDAWFRALPAKLPAGGYFTAHNSGTADLAITAASAPGACGMLMLHQTSDKGGMKGMSKVDQVSVPAGGDAVFAPGGFHLMCMQSNLTAGGTVPVTLTFSDGSKLTADFAVKDAKGQ